MAEGPEGFIWRKADVRVHYPLFPPGLFKSRRQILKHSIVLDRFIRQINTEKNKENRLDRVLMLYIATVGLNIGFMYMYILVIIV